MGPVLLTCAALLVAQTASGPSTAEERYLADLRSRIAAGDVEAEVALGNLYEAGDTVPLDSGQAAVWYRRAADKGHAGAQMNLATMYLDGHGVPQDVAQAVTWYEKAAEGGDAVARFSLASILETGAPGLSPNPAGAVQWYRRAAEQGLAGAQYRLGLLYRQGRGVPRSNQDAASWLRMAADQGEADAQIELGMLLSEGPSPDIIDAHAWLNLAASRWKHEDKRVRAATLRDELEKTMTPAQRADAYRRAADWQDRHAWRAIPKRRTNP